MPCLVSLPSNSIHFTHTFSDDECHAILALKEGKTVKLSTANSIAVVAGLATIWVSDGGQSRMHAVDYARLCEQIKNPALPRYDSLGRPVKQ